MREITLRLLMMWVLLVILGPLALAGETPTDPASWEYKAVKFSGSEGEQTKKLNALAADRWEYVGPLAGEIVCFKRKGLSSITLEFLLGKWEGTLDGNKVEVVFCDPKGSPKGTRRARSGSIARRGRRPTVSICTSRNSPARSGLARPAGTGRASTASGLCDWVRMGCCSCKSFPKRSLGIHLQAA
jgi:hypothetical protein